MNKIYIFSISIFLIGCAFDNKSFMENSQDKKANSQKKTSTNQHISLSKNSNEFHTKPIPRKKSTDSKKESVSMTSSKRIKIISQSASSFSESVLACSDILGVIYSFFDFKTILKKYQCKTTCSLNNSIICLKHPTQLHLVSRGFYRAFYNEFGYIINILSKYKELNSKYSNLEFSISNDYKKKKPSVEKFLQGYLCCLTSKSSYSFNRKHYIYFSKIPSQNFSEDKLLNEYFKVHHPIKLPYFIYYLLKKKQPRHFLINNSVPIFKNQSEIEKNINLILSFDRGIDILFKGTMYDQYLSIQGLGLFELFTIFFSNANLLYDKSKSIKDIIKDKTKDLEKYRLKLINKKQLQILDNKTNIKNYTNKYNKLEEAQKTQDKLIKEIKNILTDILNIIHRKNVNIRDLQHEIQKVHSANTYLQKLYIGYLTKFILSVDLIDPLSNLDSLKWATKASIDFLDDAIRLELSISKLKLSRLMIYLSDYLHRIENEVKYIKNCSISRINDYKLSEDFNRKNYNGMLFNSPRYDIGPTNNLYKLKEYLYNSLTNDHERSIVFQKILNIKISDIHEKKFFYEYFEKPDLELYNLLNRFPLSYFFVVEELHNINSFNPYSTDHFANSDINNFISYDPFIEDPTKMDKVFESYKPKE